MFGNILIALAIVFYALLANLTQKPMPGGDYGVGYAFAWMICIAGFGIFTGLSAWNMAYSQCFDWAPASFFLPRNGLVFLGCAAFIVTVVWSLEYRGKWVEGELPEFMRWLVVGKVQYWLPALTFIPALYLLNTQRQAGVAPIWVKLSVIASFIVCILIGLGLFYGFVKASVQRRAAAAQSSSAEFGSDQYYLEEIDNYTYPTIEGLLTYTHREKSKTLRDAAVAKIRTYADWETQLKNNLDRGEPHEVYWVFAFLDGNDVDHTEDFVQPVKKSIGRMIPQVKAILKDPNSLGLGYIHVETICRVLDTHFKDSVAVFRPEMELLQKALQTHAPERIDKQNKAWFEELLQASRLAVKKWLETN